VVETNTMPETNFTIVQGTLTVVEYGNSVPYSGKLDALSQWDVKRPVMQALKNDAVKTFDRAVHTQFNNTLLRVCPGQGTSTTSLTLTTNGTMTTSNTAAYNSTYHKLLVDLMKERNIPPYLGDDYIAIAWPSTYRTLKNNMETLHQYTAPGLGLIMAGEIGRYENCRFVEQTNILKGINNDGNGWVGALSDWMYIFGEDTVMEGVVVPEEIRAKIPTDYGRSKGVAYYALMGWGLVQQSVADMRIVKWDTAA
jgi:N4-gp56 family major capsid protein